VKRLVGDKHAIAEGAVHVRGTVVIGLKSSNEDIDSLRLRIVVVDIVGSIRLGPRLW